MSGYGPPALVESPKDMIEYWVKDSTPVDPNAGKGYREIYIMGELFRRFPQIHAAIHSHAPEVLPYCCSDVELKPVFHLGGFLGDHVPVWDIRKDYDETDSHEQNMLVNNTTLGASLASAFSKDPDGKNILDYNVVLQANHGYTTHGPDIETAVFRALYTKTNASVQTEATLLQAATAKLMPEPRSSQPIKPLTGRVVTDCRKMNEATQDKAWKLWLKEVRVDPLYANELDV